jgi:hypothetical protein
VATPVPDVEVGVEVEAVCCFVLAASRKISDSVATASLSLTSAWRTWPWEGTAPGGGAGALVVCTVAVEDPSSLSRTIGSSLVLPLRCGCGKRAGWTFPTRPACPSRAVELRRKLAGGGLVVDGSGIDGGAGAVEDRLPWPMRVEARGRRVGAAGPLLTPDTVAAEAAAEARGRLPDANGCVRP